MNNINVRLEEEKDYRTVEELTREAFWREERIEKIGIGATEHYMVHSLRKKDGIKELDFVAEIDGRVVGHVIYSKAHILKPNGEKISVLNFGPLSVLPKYQKQGIGSALMKYSIGCAKKLGYGAILFFGHATYYPRFGFVDAKEFGITTEWGGNNPSFMAMELKEGYLKDVTGKYIEAPIYSEKLTKEPAKEYDKNFKVKNMIRDYKQSDIGKMIYEADTESKRKLFHIFKAMKDTMILSCLQGHMGKAYVDNIENPTAAEIIVGELVFFAGDPNAEAAVQLLNNLPKNCFVVLSTDGWKDCIEKIHEGHVDKFQRYAFKKDKKYLNYNHIKSFLSMLPEGYELKKVDKAIAYDKSFHEVSEDFTAQFDSIEDYLNRGVGFCILYEGKVVCGASSYSIYDSGIEIQIDTHPSYRRKGLATVAAAALILYCLDRGIYPSWDAANLTSVHLAEKLGYVVDEAYDTYHIKDKK